MTELIDICIVSGQTLPNLIPIAQRKPKMVILLVSDDMREQVSHHGLLRALRHIGYDENKNQNLQQKFGFPTGNLQHDEEVGLDMFDSIKTANPNMSLSLNVTGGNKLMALALLGCYEAAANLELDAEGALSDHVIYTDTAQGVIHVVRPSGQPSIPLASVLDIPTYLTAANLSRIKAWVKNTNIPEYLQERKAACKFLAKHCLELTRLIREINRRYGGSDKTLVPSKLTRFPNKTEIEALQKLQHAKLVDWDGAQEITPMNAEACKFLTGGWLEDFAFWSAFDKGVEHVMLSVTFDSAQKKTDVPNELDVVIVHKNRMLVIECKTSKFGVDQRKDSDQIYKLDSLRKIVGGSFAQGMLISAQPLNHTTSKGETVNVRERAERHSLSVLEADEIKDLQKVIEHWRDFGQVK